VRRVGAAALAVQATQLTLGSAWPRRVEGKTGALRTAIVKLDQLLYESSLLKRNGRRTQQIDWQPAPGGASGAVQGQADE
jgi:hypothetical protein